MSEQCLACFEEVQAICPDFEKATGQTICDHLRAEGVDLTKLVDPTRVIAEAKSIILYEEILDNPC